MRKILLSALFMALFTSLFAQLPVLTGNKGLIPIKGGSGGKTYAVIVRTNLSKQALVDTTTNFLLRYGVVNKNDIKLDEINESTSEYSIPFLLRQTVYIAAGTMGAKMFATPVQITGELRFEFHDNGGVMIVSQNLKNHIFQFTTDRAKLESPAHDKYKGEESAQLTANSAIGKALIGLNTGIEGYSSFMKKADEYFADIVSKYEVYETLTNKDKVAKWFTDEELVKHAETLTVPGIKYTLESYKKAYIEEKMIGIGQKRWEDQLRQCFDLLFKSINAGLNGKIEGVAEDGEQTWTLVDGLVVPTDPKLQKKYLKDKEQY